MGQFVGVWIYIRGNEGKGGCNSGFEKERRREPAHMRGPEGGFETVQIEKNSQSLLELIYNIQPLRRGKL